MISRKRAEEEERGWGQAEATAEWIFHRANIFSVWVPKLLSLTVTRNPMYTSKNGPWKLHIPVHRNEC